MRRTIWVLAIGAAAVSGPSIAQQAPRTTDLQAVSGLGAIDNSTQTQDIHFRTDPNDRMTVPVRLGGTGPYRFLVDTGADRTAISRELAVQLKLTAGDSAELHSVAGASTVSTANLLDLQLTRKALRVIDAPVLESANMGADGILGVDSLRSQRIVFDFAAHTMSIVPSATPDFGRGDPNTIIVTAYRKNGRLVLTDATANGHDVKVVIDTGSQVSIGNDALREALLGRRAATDSQPVELQSVTGEKIAGDYMFIRELKLGGVTLNNLAIVFANAHTFKKLKLDDRPAILLGMNAMRAFKKVSIDFANRKFRVMLPEHSELEMRMAGRATRIGVGR